MTTPISELELSVASQNYLTAAGITTIEQLQQADLQVIFLGRLRRYRKEVEEVLGLHQNHLDRQIQPELWQFVLANKEVFELLRQGRATIQVKINLNKVQS